MYKNSDKDLQKIKKEIDELANKLIENYFKAKNNLNKIGELYQDNSKKNLYHGSSEQNLKRLEPHNSTHGNYLYATPYKELAIIFSKNSGSDYTYYLGKINDNEPYKLVERIPGAFEVMFNNSASIYTVSSDTFKDINTGFSELVSEVGVDTLSEEYIPNLYEKIKELEKEGFLKIYTYNNKPNEVPFDNSDLINKEIRQQKRKNKEITSHTFDNLIYYHPYLMEKINNKLKELNINFEYKKENIVDIFERKVIESELNPKREQFIESAYINISNTYPELKEILNKRKSFITKSKEEKISILLDKFQMKELNEKYKIDKRSFKEIGNEIVKKHKEKDNKHISTTPSITDLRRERKRRKKEKRLKMSDIERNMHFAIIQKQKMMKQKDNKKEKTKVKKYKSSDNKGFIDVMFGSIISIIIGLIIFSIIK